MPAGVIKLTNEEMLQIAQQGQSHCDSYSAQTRALVNVANEFATMHMRGAAGLAVLNKTTELQQTVDRMTQTSSEKYQASDSSRRPGSTPLRKPSRASWRSPRPDHQHTTSLLRFKGAHTMSGEINYDLVGIQGGLATVMGIHAQKQDIGNQMVQQYTHLDSIASGRATDAGMEFSNMASHARARRPRSSRRCTRRVAGFG